MQLSVSRLPGETKHAANCANDPRFSVRAECDQTNCIQPFFPADGARVIVGQVVAQVAGGSYRERSFLRAALVEGSREGQVLLVYGRGSGVTDTRLVVKEVGTERTMQEVNIGKPVLDIQAAEINGSRYLAALGETELTMYKWE